MRMRICALLISAVCFTCSSLSHSHLSASLPLPLQAPYVTAFKRVGCGEGIDVVVSQGTLKDLQASSSVGSNFRGLTIGAIALALIPVGCCVGIGGAPGTAGPAAFQVLRRQPHALRALLAAALLHAASDSASVSVCPSFLQA